MREFLEILLARNGYDVTAVDSGINALPVLDTREFDLVITDLRMPKISGLDVLRASRDKHPHTEVIMVTAFATAETAIAAMKEGAYDYLTKPFKVDEILVTLERAMEKRNLVRANTSLRAQLSGRTRLESLVGRSSVMQRVFELVRKVAAARTSVLVMGESGTGKELVARAIHALGDRSDAPFIPVNCGAIPDALIESELFGHVRGAFTGATADKEGLFTAADSGTLFLDEIAELPQGMQVKLLRTLQERTIKPVGATRESTVDVRVIAATNRNLDEEVAEGRFRSDLFYRLNVIPIILPPLRDRREDVALLVDHFVHKYSALTGKTVFGVSADAMRRLAGHHYPGNVRELENLIERAVTLTSERRLDTHDFPDLGSSEHPIVAEDLEIPESGLDLDAHIGRIEQALLRVALDRTTGNRTEAAQLLGISLRSMRYRLSKYGIDGDE
ncbi:MAG: sigma-54-dependent Fis family transcriptional regulator [Myxococcales bacterium]|nr:sigma-54-dependent Fis family transcriptional regulator [Myxococcales bacterium]